MFNTVYSGWSEVIVLCYEGYSQEVLRFCYVRQSHEKLEEKGFLKKNYNQ